MGAKCKKCEMRKKRQKKRQKNRSKRFGLSDHHQCYCEQVLRNDLNRLDNGSRTAVGNEWMT